MRNQQVGSVARTMHGWTLNIPSDISRHRRIHVDIIHLVSVLPHIGIVFEQLTSNCRKMVSIRGVVDKIGQSVSCSFLGVYLYTDCDYTGRFNTITKARALNTFIRMKDDTVIVSTFSNFGESTEITSG